MNPVVRKLFRTKVVKDIQGDLSFNIISNIENKKIIDLMDKKIKIPRMYLLKGFKQQLIGEYQFTCCSEEKLIHINNIDISDIYIQLEIVRDESNYIAYINNPNKEVQLTAVKNKPFSIYFIKNPDKEVQLTAVNIKPHIIRDIHKPYKEVQLTAVKNKPSVIKYIENPDKDVQLTAVSNDPLSIKYIEYPNQEVIDFISENYPDLEY